MMVVVAIAIIDRWVMLHAGAVSKGSREERFDTQRRIRELGCSATNSRCADTVISKRVLERAIVT
jgi:hypothetical protein